MHEKEIKNPETEDRWDLNLYYDFNVCFFSMPVKFSKCLHSVI